VSKLKEVDPSLGIQSYLLFYRYSTRGGKN